jgi:hypothetical protein
MEQKRDMKKELTTVEVQEQIYKRRIEEKKWNKGLEFEEAVNEVNTRI